MDKTLAKLLDNHKNLLQKQAKISQEIHYLIELSETDDDNAINRKISTLRHEQKIVDTLLDESIRVINEAQA